MKKEVLKLKENKNGITLIALVITIIVLLILAGVTISTLTGDNGLITKASEAKIATEKSALREEIDLLLLQAQMGENLENLFKGATVTKDDGSVVYEVKNYKGEDFLVSGDYEYIEKVEPAYEGEWTFNDSTQTLTAYKGDLTTKRGNQEIGEVIIPNYFNEKRVKAIDSSFFRNSNLTKLTISEGVETIGYRIFRESGLSGNLVFPNSLINIGDQAFYGCRNLNETIKFGNKLQTIGNSAFCGCSGLIGDLIIPDSVTQIGNSAFKDCTSLNGKLKLSNNLISINDAAFQNCNNLIGDLIIPDSVTSIGHRAFWRCTSLDGNLKLSKSLLTIGEDSFYDCIKLNGDLEIPTITVSVGIQSFSGMNLITEIRFLNKTTEINSVPPKAIIKGYDESTAQTYANDNNKTFQLIT